MGLWAGKSRRGLKGQQEPPGWREGQVFWPALPCRQRPQGRMHMCVGSLASGTNWGRSSALPGEVSGGAAEPGLESQLSLSNPIIQDASLPLSMARFPISGLMTTCLSCSCSASQDRWDLSLKGPRVERSVPGRAWSAVGTEYAKAWGSSPKLHFSSPSPSKQDNDGG